MAAERMRRPTTSPGVWAGRVLFGLIAISLALASVYWDALGKPWGPGTSAAFAYLMFGFHLSFLFKRVSPMDPLVWVPVGLLLFYFGMPVVIEWLGVPTPGGYDAWNANNGGILDRGFCVALLALAAFLWGVHLAGVVDASHPPGPDVPRDRSLGVPAALFTIGALIMTAIGIAIVGPSAVFGSYSDWWDSKLLGADQRFVDTGLMLSGAGVYALLASDDPKARWRRWFAYAVMLFCLFVALQKGDRTNMVTIGVGAGWCYSQRIRKLSWTPVLVAAFCALLAFPVIAEWRQSRRVEAVKRSTVKELIGASIYNLGSSVNAIVYTVHLVPDRRPYSWGGTFAAAVVNAIPNVSLTKGAKWKATDLEDSPSTWITWQINPGWAASGGGYGFAMAAEWYYNFGTLGVLLGMALTGFGVTRARNASTRSSLALLWSATLYAATSIWIRNIVGYAFKVAVWPVIGLWLIRRLVMLMRGRAARPRTVIRPPAPSEL